MATGQQLIAVVMMKRPEPGRVKTRLVRSGLVDEHVAAALADAMLRCTIRRLPPAWELILAVDGDPAPDDARWLEGCEAGPDPSALARSGARAVARVVGQGPGDLGERMDRVWRAVAPKRPVAFFGIDCPDVPAGLLDAIVPALRRADLAIGPTFDGGFWTLAARSHRPAALRDIDWDGGDVYDQACRRIEATGASLERLGRWSDVDLPDDVHDLRGRLGRGGKAGDGTEDVALRDLGARLEELLGESVGRRRRRE